MFRDFKKIQPRHINIENPSRTSLIAFYGLPLRPYLQLHGRERSKETVTPLLLCSPGFKNAPLSQGTPPLPFPS